MALHDVSQELGDDRTTFSTWLNLEAIQIVVTDVKCAGQVDNGELLLSCRKEHWLVHGLH
eukprot:CAMPEP_0180764118 /NCGR_PEP_ID=MMETSP1038_2-20121128/38285_1 /TAXON_ID=632150 /ORGANISM="Azadinium spinosum, Strain 3D9" /LENGTH=59 /DNA_ID=CAMNT_0022798529 /DNA_START=136 /DNA_END=315 /DNA_ORIENTATION=-